MHTLTQAEARQRSGNLEVHEYCLHLDVTEAATSPTFPVQTQIRFRTWDSQVFLDYVGQSVESMTVNEKPANFQFDGSRILLEVPVGEVEATICSTSTYSRTGQGLHRMHDAADGQYYLYSHLEPSDARRIYPCFDQPDLKAVFNTTITAPEGWVTLDNGTDKPMSTYLSAFAAGPYVCREEGRFRAFARASMEQYLDAEILEVTRQGMEFFETNFGPYPWDKYDSIFVPEYNLGAMENPGLVTFNEKYLFRSQATRPQRAARANTILHEMSHMWFGDLVTPRWWDDLWLKESFAEFSGADASIHATDYTEAWAEFAATRKNWAYQQDQLPTTHPIKAEIPDVDAARQNFDGITYAKGAAVLKQLVHFIGRDNFYAGARDYFQDHAFGSATFADLLGSLSAHTDRDLDAWAEQWLKTSGVDTLTPQVADGHLRIEGATRPHRLDVSLFDADLNLLQTLDLDLPGEPVAIPDAALIVVNDHDHAYAKVRFDERSLGTLRQGFGKLPLETRAVIWTALWQATRDGAYPARDYLDLVLDFAASEAPGIMTTAFANAHYAARHFVDYPSYADRLWSLLSDTQGEAALILARAAVDVVGPDRLRKLGGIVKLDPDLEWAILRALAARNAVGIDELEAAKAADATLTGAACFLGARWAYPAEKDHVLELILAPGAHSNDEVTQLLRAFNAPAAQLDEYAAEILGRVDWIWDNHPIEIANRIIRGLYPLNSAGAEYEILQSGALGRVLLECRDQARRIQRVRAAQ